MKKTEHTILTDDFASVDMERLTVDYLEAVRDIHKSEERLGADLLSALRQVSTGVYEVMKASDEKKTGVFNVESNVITKLLEDANPALLFPVNVPHIKRAITVDTFMRKLMRAFVCSGFKALLEMIHEDGMPNRKDCGDASDRDEFIKNANKFLKHHELKLAKIDPRDSKDMYVLGRELFSDLYRLMYEHNKFSYETLIKIFEHETYYTVNDLSMIVSEFLRRFYIHVSNEYEQRG